MYEDTPILQQTDKFWASVENKNNLQLLVRNMVNNISEANPKIFVSSVVCIDEIFPAIGPRFKEFPELLSWIEETDNRLIVHVEWAVRIILCQHVVIVSSSSSSSSVSNDTTTSALLYTIFHTGSQWGWKNCGSSMPLARKDA